MLRSLLAQATSIPDSMVSQNLLSAYPQSQVPRLSQRSRVEILPLSIRSTISCISAWLCLRPHEHPRCVEPRLNFRSWNSPACLVCRLPLVLCSPEHQTYRLFGASSASLLRPRSAMY